MSRASSLLLDSLHSGFPTLQSACVGRCKPRTEAPTRGLKRSSRSPAHPQHGRLHTCRWHRHDNGTLFEPKWTSATTLVAHIRPPEWCWVDHTGTPRGNAGNFARMAVLWPRYDNMTRCTYRRQCFHEAIPGVAGIRGTRCCLCTADKFL
eukprot:425692-Prymnesium_polylepis.1